MEEDPSPVIGVEISSPTTMNYIYTRDTNALVGDCIHVGSAMIPFATRARSSNTWIGATTRISVIDVRLGVMTARHSSTICRDIIIWIDAVEHFGRMNIRAIRPGVGARE